MSGIQTTTDSCSGLASISDPASLYRALAYQPESAEAQTTLESYVVVAGRDDALAENLRRGDVLLHADLASGTGAYIPVEQIGEGTIAAILNRLGRLLPGNLLLRPKQGTPFGSLAPGFVDEAWEDGSGPEGFPSGWLGRLLGNESQTVTFPSGASLAVVSGPIERGQEHFDPHQTQNPLLDVSGAKRSTRLSKNFTVSEFLRRGDIARIDPALVRCLQTLRDLVGKPVRITSAYRSYGYNTRLYKGRGQKPTDSRHSSGQAADVKIKGLNGLEIAKLAIDACGCRLGLGIGGDNAHLDVRGEFAKWRYRSAGANDLAKLVRHHREHCRGGTVTISTPRAVATGTAGALPRAQMPTSELRKAWAAYRCRIGGEWNDSIRFFGRNIGGVPSPATDAYRALEQALMSSGYTPKRAGSYSCRPIRGSDPQRWSLHAYGIAIDLDARQNPFSSGDPFSGLLKKHHVDSVYAIRSTSGRRIWSWGGYWNISRGRDRMHFQLDRPPTDVSVDWSSVPR